MSGVQRAQPRPYAAKNSGTHIDAKRPRFTVVHIAGAGFIVLDPEGVKRSEPVEQKHVAQAHLQFRGIEMRVPRTDRTVLVVEHPHHLHGEVADVAHPRVDVRTAHRARRRGLEIAEVRLLAGPGMVLRDVQPGSTRHD